LKNNPNHGLSFAKRYLAFSFYSLFLISGLPNAQASISTWDLQGKSGSNPYTGSLSGTWESSYWSTSESGQTTPTSWTEGNAALFAARSGTSTPAFTVTMNSNHSVGGVFDGSLNSGAGPCTVTLAGSGIMTIGASGFSTGSSASVTINTVIAGSGQVVLESTTSGGGALYLNGVNTFTGGMELGYSSSSPFSGTVYFNNNSSFGTGAISLSSYDSGGAIVAEGSSAYTLANAVDLLNVSFNITGTTGGVTFSGPWDTGTAGVCTLNLNGAANTTVTISGNISDEYGFT